MAGVRNREPVGNVLKLRGLRYRPHFEKAVARLRIAPGGYRARRLAATIGRLRASQVMPCDESAATVIPPTTWCWSHRVSGTNLELLYDFDDDLVVLITVKEG